MTRRFAIGLLVVTGVCIASGMHIECVDNEEGQGFKDPKADLQLPCFQGGEDVCSKVFPENESQRDFCKNICCATQKVSNSTPPARHLRAKVIPTMPGMRVEPEVRESMQWRTIAIITLCFLVVSLVIHLLLLFRKLYKRRKRQSQKKFSVQDTLEHDKQ